MRISGLSMLLIGLYIVLAPMIKDQVVKSEYDLLEEQVSSQIEASRISLYLNQLKVSLPSSQENPGPLDQDEAIDMPLDQESEEEARDDQALIDAYLAMPTEALNDGAGDEEIPVSEPVVYTEAERNQHIKNKFSVDGFLIIEAIDLKTLIIEGATLEHLDFSASSMVESKKPWEPGNYVIAGHRSLKYGRHFNRLNEMEMGDEIIFEAISGQIYHYEVYEQSIVHESDYSVIKSDAFNEITLITCDPIGEKHPEYRLIVKAKKID